MKYLRTLIFLLVPVLLVVDCTYDKGTTYYSQACKTSFTGFPDIPGWNFENIPIDASVEYIKRVYFFEEKEGILIADDEIWLTEDEGEHWEKVFSGMFLSVYDIFFIDPLNGFIAAVVDFKTCILKTFDGGKTWSILYQPERDFIKKFSFVNDTLGFAYIYHWDIEHSVSRSYFVRTNDGGINWEEISGLSMSTPVNATIKIFNNGFGYILGGVGDIHFTNDFGDSWTTKKTGINIDHIQFLDQKTGFISDFSHLFRTLDGGITWIRISEYGSPWFHFFSSTDGITLQTIAIDVIPDRFEELYVCNAFFTIYDDKTKWEEGPPSLSFYIDDVTFVNDHLGYGKTYQDGIRIVKLYR